MAKIAKCKFWIKKDKDAVKKDVFPFSVVMFLLHLFQNIKTVPVCHFTLVGGKLG